MKTTIIFFALSIPVAALAQPGYDQPVTPRDIPYYMANPSIMNQTLRVCHSNAAYGRLPDCQNAERAATGLMANEKGQSSAKTAGVTVFSPEWWDGNPIVRETVITQCNRRGPGDQIAYPYCKLAGNSKLRAMGN